MKRFENRERIEWVCVEHKCDLCNGEITNQHETGVWCDYQEEVTEYASRMDDYPTTRLVNRQMHFDICIDCFREKLVPWMKEQGAEPSTEPE